MANPVGVKRTALHFLRIIMQIITNVMLVAAIVLLAVGLGTSDWIIADFRTMKATHTHGLWEWCTTTTFQGRQKTDCNYKTYQEEADMSPSERDHLGKDWEMTTLALVAVGGVLGVFALLFGLCATCLKCCNFVWCLFAFIGALISAAGVALFTRMANEPRNRNVQEASMSGDVAEAHLGNAYKFAVTGVGVYVIAAVLSTITVGLACLVANEDRKSRSSAFMATYAVPPPTVAVCTLPCEPVGARPASPTKQTRI